MIGYAEFDSKREAMKLQDELYAEAKLDPTFVGDRWAYPLYESKTKKYYIKVRDQFLTSAQRKGHTVVKTQFRKLSRLTPITR